MNFIIEILTAIGDQNLNNALRFESEFEIPEKDISYREGVLESLEKEKRNQKRKKKQTEIFKTRPGVLRSPAR